MAGTYEVKSVKISPMYDASGPGYPIGIIVVTTVKR